MESDSIFSNALDEYITEEPKNKIPFENSFASYEGKTEKGKLKKDCWIVQKNNGLTPRDITKGSGKKFWFQCDTCPHKFCSMVNNINDKSRWCPYCVGQKLCEDEKCDYCYQNSFASYEGKTKKGKLKKDCWIIEKNNRLIPRNVTKGSGKKYWFQCDECPHQFEKRIDNTTCKAGWCPYCSNRKLCDKEDCNHCYQNSFAGFNGKTNKGKLKKDCWIVEKNGGLTPCDFMKHCGRKKFWFQCDECPHQFTNTLDGISYGRWCPHCVNKTEKMFKEWFKKQYEYKLQSQKRFQWCKNPETKRILPFDFCIPDLKLIIEIDGRQHFEQVWNWKAPELQQERDVFKMNLALDNGYTIIRIYQPDIYLNRDNWDKETEEAIKKYDVPEIICIGRKQLK